MRIEIERNKNVKLERKAKLKNILSEEKVNYEEGFRWRVLEQPTSQEEADAGVDIIYKLIYNF